MAFGGSIDERRGAYRRGRVLRGAANLAELSLSCELTTERPEDFSATLWSIAYENAAITRFQSTPIVSRRTLEHLGDPYTRFVQFGFIRSGSVSFSQRGVHGALRPGDGSLLLLDEPYVVTMLEDTEIVQVHLPSDLLELKGVPVAQLAGFQWRSSPLIDIIVSFLTRLTAAAPGTANIGGGGVERSLLELICALLSTAVVPAQSDFHPDDAMLRRALKHVHLNATDPHTSADSICAALGISRRHLYNLFDHRAITLSQLIRGTRADAAKRLLLDPSLSYSVPEIAARAGFAGGDQLSRAFKAKYGVTPGAYRAQVRDIQRHGH